MTTTQSFVPTVAPMSLMLNATAQSFVPTPSTTQSILNSTAQSFVPPVCREPFTLEGFMLELSQGSSVSEVSNHCPMMPVFQRNAKLGMLLKPQKGIRNKPIKRMEQYLEIKDASPMPQAAAEVLLDCACGIALQQDLHNTAMEKTDQGDDSNDGCPMLHQAFSEPSHEASKSNPSLGVSSLIRALNLEPVRGPATACFPKGCVLECFGTSERAFSADVSRPCATGPPGLGRRRGYRSPAKRNRDKARNDRYLWQRQPSMKIESDKAQESSEHGFADNDACIEQSMMGTPQPGIEEATEDIQSKDEPSSFSIQDLLKRRSVVLGEGLSENVVVCSAMHVEKTFVKNGRVYVASENGAPKNWREDKPPGNSRSLPPQFTKPTREVRMRQFQAKLDEIFELNFDEVDPSQQDGLTHRMLVALKSLSEKVKFWQADGMQSSEEGFKLLGLEEPDMYAIERTIRQSEKLLDERRFREAYYKLSAMHHWFDPETLMEARAKASGHDEKKSFKKDEKAACDSEDHDEWTQVKKKDKKNDKKKGNNERNNQEGATWKQAGWKNHENRSWEQAGRKNAFKKALSKCAGNLRPG